MDKMLRVIDETEDQGASVAGLTVVVSILLCLLLTVFCYVIAKKRGQICKKKKEGQFDQIGVDSGRKIDHSNNTTFTSIELGYTEAASRTASVAT